MRLALLTHFANYYNRKVKKLDSYVDYQPYLSTNAKYVGEVNPISQVNFKPNDGVMTDVVVNWSGQTPDYVLALDDDYNESVSMYNQFAAPTTRVPGSFVGGQGVDFTVFSDGTFEFYGDFTAENEYRVLYSANSFTLPAGKYILGGCGPLSHATLELVNVGTADVVQQANIGTVIGSQRYTDQPQVIEVPSGKYIFRYSFTTPFSIPQHSNACSRPQLVNLSLMYAVPPVGSNTLPPYEQILADLPDLDNVNSDLPIVRDEGTPNLLDEHCTRWFVIDSDRLRAGQYHLTLRRDVVVDNYNSIVSAPAFIEKATPSADDPAIYNHEDMTFNQIKTGETELRDKTDIAWIVGYLDRQVAEDQDVDITIPVTQISADYVISSLSAWSWFTYTTSSGKYVVSGPRTITQATTAGAVLSEDITLQDMDDFMHTYHNVLSRQQTDELLQLDGKVLYESINSTYYRIKVNKANVKMTNVTVPATSELGIKVINATHNSSTITLSYTYGEFSIELSVFPVAQTTLKISHTRRHTYDAPYDIFCLPYGDFNIEIPDNIGSSTYVNLHCSKEASMAAAMKISQIYASQGKLYDLQILPYCPIMSSIRYGSRFRLLSTDYGVTWNQSSSVNREATFIAWVDNASFKTVLEYEIGVSDAKIENECDKYRLCSPNYASAYDFSPAMNQGVDYFEAECTYLPITPYVHVSPNFKGLYGNDYDDARGLICGGDFSLPVVKDSWLSYLGQNKTYQLAFDRQIESQLVQNKYQRVGDVVGALAGGIQGAAAGSLIGSGIVGGAVGGALSTVAGIADIAINEKLRNESLDLTKDLFSYSLQNIAAQANTLTKVSAFNFNNKIFPLLEYYTCTDTERQALRDKLKYNGYSIGRIGTITEFLHDEPTYIKGQFIQLEIDDDFHMANEISNEFNKGVYI